MKWKRKLVWIGVVLVVSIAAISLAANLILRSPRFHRYLLSQIEKQASEATGAQVQIQNFAVHLSQLAADAYGITIRNNTSARPVVQADQLRVRLRIASLVHKKVNLSEIVLRHPVVNLEVTKDGTTNLLTPPKSNSKTPTNPFDLGIRHVLLEHGEIYYNDRKTPLDADLHELQVEIKAQLVRKAYEGKLSYRNGRVLYGDMRPVPHDLTASFNASPSEFTLQSLVLRVASSAIELRGQVRNYSQPSATGSYRIVIHPQDAHFAVSNTPVPKGEVELTGSLGY